MDTFDAKLWTLKPTCDTLPNVSFGFDFSKVMHGFGNLAVTHKVKSLCPAGFALCNVRNCPWGG